MGGDAGGLTFYQGKENVLKGTTSHFLLKIRY